jgi:glycerol-3-phosphate acyltransferase PlsY
MNWLLAALAGYLFGSLPFAYWFGLLQGKNLLEAGSGNVGAKNATRVLGRVSGLLVLLLDVIKGILAVAMGAFAAKDPLGGLLAGALAVWGHCYSWLLLGNGGKGIATASGVLFAVSPFLFAPAAALIGILFGLARSLYRAVMISALLLPLLAALIFRDWQHLLFGLGVGLPVALRHVKDWNRT